MTKRRRTKKRDKDATLSKRQARARIHFWIRRLGLQTYDFTILWDQVLEDEDVEAQIVTHDDYEEAALQYSKDWREWNLRKFDEVTVHELLHTVLHGAKVAVESVYDNLSHDSSTMLRRRYRHESERAIEHLAQRIVDIEHGQTR